jgi:outer membrane receptor protein involved in Fe transport
MTNLFSVSATSGRQLFRRHSLSTAAIIALAMAAQPAFAAPQATSVMAAGIDDKTPAADAAASVPAEPALQDQSADGETQDQEVTVTGTRIVRDGYSAPTPVSVISTEEISREAPANISDFVNTLPSVRGSGTSANSNGALSNGGAGINTVNLRSLGANRTLVLVDGQRSVPSTNTGSVDVNTIPQALIERVEVVTGGASSAYGSDAVSGVVNFILNKKFTGLKAEYEHGVTTYGDAPNHKASITAGTSFADGRGHITVSGEYFTQKGIHTVDRDWNDVGFFRVNNPKYTGAACTDSSATTICYPEYIVTKDAGISSFAPGGLVTFGPLKGIYFGSINPATGFASVNKLNFGAVQPGSQWMIGGDTDITSASHRGSATLQPSEKRQSAFGRLSYEFSPALNVFAQFAYSRYRGQSYYQQTATTATSATTGVLINNDNAYLPPEVKALMAANNLTSIRVGTGNVFIDPQGSDNTREVFRYVVGADGQFNALGRNWSWDAYYQRGETKTNELLTNGWSLTRYALATDAVVVTAANRGSSGLALGSIACRSTLTSPTNGCVPVNVLGVQPNQAAAVSYLTYGGLNPLRNQTLTQDVAAVSFSTNTLFELPAGPVSLAFGGEWRKETVNGTVDPLFQPGRDADNNLVPTWLYGNFLVNRGKYSVKEGFIETVVPIIKGMDFNGAFRLTDYSSSGSVTTWKAGLTWQIIDDVKVRGTISRDIRAPNLADLFAPGGGASNSVNRPITGGTGTVTDRLITSNLGNPSLVPEIAKTYGGGFVVTPSFLPGFAASVDYYNIKLSGAISSYGIQTVADQCYQQNIASACNYIITNLGRGVIGNNADIISIEVVPQNFVSIKTSGIDFEASYRRQIGPGTAMLRGLASYAIEQRTENGVVAATDAAGQNTGNLPRWTYRFSAGYDFDSGFGVQGIARGVSGGTYDNNAIVCDTNCPVSTADFRTMNTNSIPGAIYFDMNASYKFDVAGAKSEIYFSIRNLFNTDPVLVGNGPSGDNTEAYPQTNRALYDVLGRVFRLGVRFKL